MIVVVSITLIIAVAALAIDAASWFETRHHAQVAADAAALAGANCMAQQGSTVATCSSGNTAPTTVVSDNGFSNENVQFNKPSSGEITVTVTATGSNTFAGALGMSGPTISATAVASWRGKDEQCGTLTGPNCLALFAFSSSCTGTGVEVGNKAVINGVAESNGLLNPNGNSGTSVANSYYGPNCSNPNSSQFLNAQQSQSVQLPPLDYSGLSSSANSVTPPACTNTPVPATYTYSGGGGVYCATTKLTITASTPTGGATFIAPTVTIIGSPTLQAYDWPTNELLIYQEDSGWTGSSCTTVNSTSLTFGAPVTGVIFAPCTNVVDTGNNNKGSLTGLIEAYTVNIGGNNVDGSGPEVSSGGGPIVPPADQLIQ